jgi:hypothetical protein
MGARDDLRAAQRNGHAPLEPGDLRRRVLEAVRFEPVEFLVPGRVPLRGVTLVVGDPGLGKSTWTCLVAAGASVGAFGEPTRVAVVNAEDSLAAVVGPRLKAAGGDLSMIEALSAGAGGDTERLLTLPDDIALIEEFVVDTASRLVVLDPLMAFVSTKVDTNQDHAIRRALGELAAMADRHGVSALVAGHLNKNEQQSLIYRVGGSIGLVGAARSILLFARDPEDPEGATGPRRLVAHAKSNWAELAPTLRYRVEAATVWQDDKTFATSRLVPEGTSELAAEELVGRRKDAGKTRDAMAEILEALGDGAPHLSREVKRDVREEVGCGLRTVERAAEELVARGELVTEGETSSTTWQLPPTPAKSVSRHGGGSANPVAKPNSSHAAMAGEGMAGVAGVMAGTTPRAARSSAGATGGLTRDPGVAVRRARGGGRRHRRIRGPARGVRGAPRRRRRGGRRGPTRRARACHAGRGRSRARGVLAGRVPVPHAAVVARPGPLRRLRRPATSWATSSGRAARGLARAARGDAGDRPPRRGPLRGLHRPPARRRRDRGDPP